MYGFAFIRLIIEPFYRYAVPNKLPGKTVSILAHRKRRLQHDKANIERKRQQHLEKAKRVKHHHKFRRAESFVMEYLKSERTANRMRRIMERGDLMRSADMEEKNHKLLLVMRHAGKKICNKETQNIFITLKMPKRHQAVFLENSKENRILLKFVEPFVVYGYPSVSTVRELIYKKGFAKINGQKTPIQSNTLVESQLADKGIICLEDIIHEITTVGENFQAAKDFLCSFMVSLSIGLTNLFYCF